MSSDPLRVALLLALIGRLRADLPPADVPVRTEASTAPQRPAGGDRG